MLSLMVMLMLVLVLVLASLVRTGLYKAKLQIIIFFIILQMLVLTSLKLKGPNLSLSLFP